MLTAYEWQERTNALRRRRLSTSRVCNRIDLYSLAGKRLRPDVVERDFFQQIDSDGARARDILVAGDVRALDAAARKQFARFLLSLEVRRPDFVARARENGRKYFAASLDADPEVLAAMATQKMVVTPSVYVEQKSGITSEDRAIINLPGVVLHPERLRQVMSWNWGVLRVDDRKSFIIGDRPLCRTTGSNQPDVVWAIPLTPTHVFIASPNPDGASRARRLPTQKLERIINVAIAGQSDKSVFVSQDRHAAWLGRYLRRNSTS